MGVFLGEEEEEAVPRDASDERQRVAGREREPAKDEVGREGESAAEHEGIPCHRESDIRAAAHQHNDHDAGYGGADAG